jgi:hypothetical protein
VALVVEQVDTIHLQQILVLLELLVKDLQVVMGLVVLAQVAAEQARLVQMVQAELVGLAVLVQHLL